MFIIFKKDDCWVTDFQVFFYALMCAPLHGWMQELFWICCSTNVLGFAFFPLAVVGVWRREAQMTTLEQACKLVY